MSASPNFQIQKSGSVTGAVLLISGCCIGAGMLGLPMMSSLAGFFPTLLMFFVSWAYMTTTALLLLEVNLSFTPYEKERSINLITMAESTLGPLGKWVAWGCFAFLFYALGVAYIAGCGELIADFAKDSFALSIPNWLASLAVSALFGLFVYMGTRGVDLCNRLLMIGLVISYVVLISIGASHVEPQYLKHVDWTVAIAVTPFMIISFGFHNLVPSLTNYLHYDVVRLKKAIILGSLIPLIIYIIWEGLILGLVPVSGPGGFLEVIENEGLVTEVLKSTVGSSTHLFNWVLLAAQVFALFAILTSFLGNSLSFVDFLADGFKVKKNHFNKFWLCLLVIVPPFSMALIYPRIFLTALNYAGAYGAVILFGILPSLMVWSTRYGQKNSRSKQSSIRIVPGGKWVLILINLVAFAVMALQLFEGK